MDKLREQEMVALCRSPPVSSLPHPHPTCTCAPDKHGRWILPAHFNQAVEPIYFASILSPLAVLSRYFILFFSEMEAMASSAIRNVAATKIYRQIMQFNCTVKCMVSA
jgi:hypothetical protein